MRTLSRRWLAMALVVSGAALNAACIESETRATVVIEPDGSGRWIALQRDVHAVADTPDDRLREEQEFLAKVHAEKHDQAVAFRSLGATDVKTSVLSSEWPFAVQTEARFANLADMFSRLFDALGVKGQATLARDGDRTTFTAVVRTDGEDEPSGAETDRPAQSIFGDPGPVVFLRHGQIISATGFTVSNDGRMAKVDEINDKAPTFTLSLTWTATEASTHQK